MKKYLLLIILLSIAVLSVKAETLQFKQAKLINSTGETVPANRIWKIIGIFYSSQIPDPYCTGSTSCGSISAFNDVITVGATPVTVRSARSRGNTYQLTTYSWEQEFPMWITSGTFLAASTGVYLISVLEFEVIP